MRSADTLTLREHVRSRSDLLLDGWTDRRIAAGVRDGTLHQFRRGWFIASADFGELWEEDRHRAHVVAVARDARGAAVMSHSSAAVLWGLPLYGMRLNRVHMTTAAPHRISSSPDVRRHVAPLPSHDVSIVDGIRCTSLARTVFDLSRELPLEAAVGAADAAERKVSYADSVWDPDAGAAWRGELRALLSVSSGARGIRQARWVSGFADGRAESPGESISRLQLFRLGFETPELQIPVRGPRGRYYFVDFGLRRLRVFGEFDGRQKYLDESLRSGRSIEQVMFDEKQREDWIRGTTQWRFARWEATHIRTPQTLRARLEAFGIRSP